METIQAIEIHPREQQVCYAKLPKRMNDFCSKLYSEGFPLKKIRFNIAGDFATVISGPEDDESFSLYGEPYSGKTYVTNMNLELTGFLELKHTTTETIEKNISW